MREREKEKKKKKNSAADSEQRREREEKTECVKRRWGTRKAIEGRTVCVQDRTGRGQGEQTQKNERIGADHIATVRHPNAEQADQAGGIWRSDRRTKGEKGQEDERRGGTGGREERRERRRGTGGREERRERRGGTGGREGRGASEGKKRGEQEEDGRRAEGSDRRRSVRDL